ncbi:MAG: response regulator [Kofleriaceae bacterium]
MTSLRRRRHSSHLARPRALLADDDQLITRVFSRVLRAQQVMVDAVNDPAAVLEFLEGYPYSLLVLDLQMPPVDGYQLLGEIAKRGLSVPTVLVTGHDRLDVIARVDREGLHEVVDVLTKPVTQEQLSTAVTRAVAAIATFVPRFTVDLDDSSSGGSRDDSDGGSSDGGSSDGGSRDDSDGGSSDGGSAQG